MLKLSDREKQEIIRHLEQDKELPEHYRFLLFDDKREVELVWNGKTNEVCSTVLPFQTIEQVDEPRAEKGSSGYSASLFSVDKRGRQLKGWTNKLIWGDNKLILSSLKNGPLRAEIEAQGGLKLIYIDPPFDVGADALAVDLRQALQVAGRVADVGDFLRGVFVETRRAFALAKVAKVKRQGDEVLASEPLGVQARHLLFDGGPATRDDYGWVFFVRLVVLWQIQVTNEPSAVAQERHPAHLGFLRQSAGGVHRHYLR